MTGSVPFSAALLLCAVGCISPPFQGNPITHVSIVDQPSVQQTFRSQTISKLQQMA